MARAATADEKAIAEQLERALSEEGANTNSTANDDSVLPADEPAPLSLNNDAPPDAETRRKPGRPKGSGANNAEALLQRKVEDAGGETNNKPGPKPKPKNGKKANSMDATNLAKQLAGIHMIAAMFTKTPELQLTEPEALNLSNAIVGVCDEYDLNIDGKTGAAIQLLAACAVTYGPRAFQINWRRAKERAEANLNGNNDGRATGY